MSAFRTKSSDGDELSAGGGADFSDDWSGPPSRPVTGQPSDSFTRTGNKNNAAAGGGYSGSSQSARQSDFGKLEGTGTESAPAPLERPFSGASEPVPAPLERPFSGAAEPVPAPPMDTRPRGTSSDLGKVPPDHDVFKHLAD